MFSYIFMKILESRPDRYDFGITILSGGHANKIKQSIVDHFVKPGMKILDVGCGTGTFAEIAAHAGAEVIGIDVSESMLEVARKRIERKNLAERIQILNSSATELNELFETEQFDLVVSTLVFSELYADERKLALEQIRNSLKPTGKLVIAVETSPSKIFKRIFHFLVRLPLSIITYIVAQTGTKAVPNLPGEVSASGFSILSEEYSFWDSFILLSAEKSVSFIKSDIEDFPVKKTEADYSPLLSIWDFIGRWFPNPVEPGLRQIGNPDRNAPVILTSNYHLTVRRVERALQGRNVFLLVAPSSGINVWCGAVGGEFTTHSIISAIKTSKIELKVDHKKMILPQFSAPGVDLKFLRRESGWKGVFGPAYAKSIPAYLENHKSVLSNNKAEFSFKTRMELLPAMNFVIWIPVTLLSLLLAPEWVIPIAVYFWLSGVVLYAGYPFLPGDSGWIKSLLLSLFAAAVLGLVSLFYYGESFFEQWKFMIAAAAINLALGFDLKGIVAGSPSEAEWLMKKLGMKSFGHIFSAEKNADGKIHQDLNTCNNCRSCILVCPKGVFGTVEKNVRIVDQNECFACTACVAQCRENALVLK